MVPAVALSLLMLSPAVALADGPGTGTGIAPNDDSEEWTPEELGYTTAYAEEKAAEAAPDAGVVPSVRGLEGIIPLYDDPGGGGSWPSNKVLNFTIYHQKTNVFCVPAVGQSIAHWAFGGYISPTVGEKQYAIAEAMQVGPTGVVHPNGLIWINNRFINHDSDWRYVEWDSDDNATFTSHVKYDVAGYGLPMYVTVQLASGHYAWTQGTAAKHATLATGYTASGTYVLSADPFAHKRANDTCTASWDQGAANQGCIWGGANGPYEMVEYYLARGGTDPEWY
jgi:hypothetical protein